MESDSEKEYGKGIDLQDQYDLYGLASSIETTDEIVNRDFTLADTDEKLERWANKQIKIARLLYEIIKEVDEKEAELLKQSLLSEVILKLGFTRSRDGKVLKAILAVGQAPRIQEEEEMKKERGLAKKAMDMMLGRKESGEEKGSEL